MVDHAPWRDIGSAVHTVSHLSDPSILRPLPAGPDSDVLAFVVATGEADRIPALLVREFPQWCAITAVRAELTELLETVRAVQRAIASDVQIPAPHAELAMAIGTNTATLTGDLDEGNVTDVLRRLRDRARTQIKLWADGAHHPVLDHLMTVEDPRPLARLLADRPTNTARTALRVLLSRVWPTAVMDIGQRGPLIQVSAAYGSAAELTLTASGVARAASGFLLRVAYAFRPARTHQARPGPGPRRSFQWPGPVLATDDLGFAYALVRRDRQPPADGPDGPDGPDDFGAVDLTYTPALSPGATLVRLRCDRYELHEFVLPAPGGPRPVREVTDRLIDLELAVPVPPVA